MRPNVNVDPPRIAPNMRYQTSSMRKKTPPTIVAAAYTSAGETVGFSDWSVGVAAAAGAASRRFLSILARGTGDFGNSAGCAAPDNHHAAAALVRLMAPASHRVSRVPSRSKRKNVAKSAPATAPSVLRP